MKIKIEWSFPALLLVNLVCAAIFLVNKSVTEMIPALIKVGGAKHHDEIMFVTKVITFYPYIYGLSVALSWIAFFKKKNWLVTFFALLPLIPGLIIIYVHIKFSLLKEAKSYVEKMAITKIAKTIQKFIP